MATSRPAARTPSAPPTPSTARAPTWPGATTASPRRGRTPGGSRGHGQHPQLASAAHTDGHRNLTRPRHPQAPWPPSAPRPALRHAGAHRALRGRGRPPPHRATAPCRAHGRAPPRPAAHRGHARGLVRRDRGRDGPRRSRGQWRCRPLPFARLPPLRARPHRVLPDGTNWLRCRTTTSDIRVGLAARTTVETSPHATRSVGVPGNVGAALPPSAPPCSANARWCA